MWKLVRRTTYFTSVSVSASSFTNNQKLLLSKTRGIACKNPHYQQVSSSLFVRRLSNRASDGSNSSSKATRGIKKTKNLIRSRYKDVMVKAGEDIYYLDRIKLALKSDYFEKLLVHNWSEENADPIEIPLDSDTFHSVVDVIYDEEEWSSVLNMDNYVSVLKAKHLLQMNENDYGFSNFISDRLQSTPASESKVFELFNFIVQNKNLQKSLRKVYDYLAENLEHFQNREEFLSLPVDHFIEIMANKEVHAANVREIGINWICHDLENRLQYLVKIANVARRKQRRFICELDDASIKVRLSDINEQNKRQVVGRYYDRLLHYDSSFVDPGVAVRPEDDVNNWEQALKQDEKIRENNPVKNRLKDYLKNGTLYDITVKVGEKTYKLHRSILQSKSKYFQELFSREYAEASAQCDEIPNMPDKDREYVIDEIDEATFDLIVDHIYLDTHISSTPDNILPLFKAAYILKVETLLNNFKSSAEYRIDEFDSKGITDMLDFTVDKSSCRDLYLQYLCRHVRNLWPNVAHMTEFYSISWDTLESWLHSRTFYFDDPQKFLDMCSKWIVHDLQNRYQLIPQVALAIKNYAMPDFEDYKTETPSDLASCSEQSIRERILEILCATSLIPADTSPNTEQRNFEEDPVFVTSTSGGTFDILNANFDRIATLSSRQVYVEPFFGPRYPMSSTIIKDNLFLWCVVANGHDRFVAYNIPSKKFIALHHDSRIREKSTMVNCRNELYCCGKDSSILKYSLPLNRWMSCSSAESKKDDIKFTSDGDKIYRMYQAPGTQNDLKPRYTVEAYNFEQNTWTSLPKLPSSIPIGKSQSPVDFTLINNHRNLAILFEKVILWFDDELQKWRGIRLREDQFWSENGRNNSVIAQAENEIVQVFNDKLYQYSSSDETWHLKKEMPIPWKFVYGEAPYYNIIAINRPIVRSS